MDFKRYLKEAAKKLDAEIQSVLGDWLSEVERINPKLIPLAKAFVEACKGGKRIRGTLVRLGYEIASSPSTIAQGPRNDVFRIGAAYEIFHTAILAHDDIIDQSQTRRGQPTLYEALGGDHYGISQTIALGDVGFFLAVKIMSNADFPPQYKSKALAFFAQTVIDTGLGEVLDVELPHLGGERKEEDVIAIHTLKTAQYTISGPLVLGAILGGADEKLLRVLGEFGENLGIAFQIQDDILGVFGDEKELGKSTTSDIEEGKNTLLITEALKRANPAQREILAKYYGQPFDCAQGKGNMGDRKDKGLQEIRQVFLATGSLDYSRQKGVEYAQEAKKVIPRITRDSKFSSLLTEMADFLIKRSR